VGQNIQRVTIESGIAMLTFDRTESSAYIFDQAAVEQLNEHLNALGGDSAVRGLIIRSAKPKIFIAGEDLRGFTKDLTAQKLSFLIEQGQKTFDRIAALPFPTIAAIHGVAVGGGSAAIRSEEHTSELQSHLNLVCRLLLEKKKNHEKLSRKHAD